MIQVGPTPLQVFADYSNRKRVFGLAGDTIYYATNPSVSSTSYDGVLAAGADLKIASTYYFVTAPVVTGGRPGSAGIQVFPEQVTDEPVKVLDHTPTDDDFPYLPPDGIQALDESTDQLYVRDRDGWTVAITGTPYFVDVAQPPYNARFTGNPADAAFNTAAIQAALDAAAVAGVTSLTDFTTPARVVQLPPGRAYVTTLNVPTNVWLRGHGPSSTYLSRTGSGGSGAILTVTGVQHCLSDLGVICDDPGVSCIDLSGSGTGYAGGTIIDPREVIRDVVCIGGLIGVIGAGNEMRLSRITCERQQQHGFYSQATDSFIEGCTAAGFGQANVAGDVLAANGFSIGGANSRIYGCKAFGGLGGNDCNGLAISGAGRHQVTCCEAQDCEGNGYSIAGNQPSTLTSCVADSCGRIGFDNGFANTLDGCSAVNRGGAYTMAGAVGISAGGVGLLVRGLVTHDVRRIHLAGGSYIASSYGGVDIDQIHSFQSVAYAVAITPDPWVGGEIRVGTLTGAITINNPVSALEVADQWPTGLRLSFWLTQDGSGGHAVTFGAAYKTTAAISTTLSTTTFIEFSWDGTNWRETSRAIT